MEPEEEKAEDPGLQYWEADEDEDLLEGEKKVSFVLDNSLEICRTLHHAQRLILDCFTCITEESGHCGSTASCESCAITAMI